MSDKIPGSSYYNAIIYRERWRIYLSDCHPMGGFAYVHEDYDGVEDSGDGRCGWAKTADLCKAEIDEYEEANA